jgi:hypothetical protein
VERMPVGTIPPEGKRVLAGELTSNAGVPLAPRN